MSVSRKEEEQMGKMLLCILAAVLLLVAAPVLWVVIQLLGPVVLILAAILFVPVAIGGMIGYAVKSREKGGEE